MLSSPGSWFWDFWITKDDCGRYHIYFLNAPHSLGDPGRRHRAARIDHAVSDDLSTWEIVGRAFEAGDDDAFDATATWTGCVVRGDDGLWRMFYTGSQFLRPEPDYANIETIGVAVSSDLTTWTKLPGPITRADPRWYETYPEGGWKEEAWRDPWVFRDPSGSGWHMLVTARAKDGPLDDRGVIGHAFSSDLGQWEVLPPLSMPGSGFGHLEVPQIELINGQWVLIFSCGPNTLASSSAFRDANPGTWAMPITAPGSAMDVTCAQPVTTTQHYSGRLIKDRDDKWMLMTFLGTSPDGKFRGVISDPIPVVLGAEGRPFVQDEDFEASMPATS